MKSIALPIFLLLIQLTGQVYAEDKKMEFFVISELDSGKPCVAADGLTGEIYKQGSNPSGYMCINHFNPFGFSEDQRVIDFAVEHVSKEIIHAPKQLPLSNDFFTKVKVKVGKKTCYVIVDERDEPLEVYDFSCD